MAIDWETPRRGALVLDSWAGRTLVPVEVIGQTPMKWRIRALTLTHLAGRKRVLVTGATALVPRGAVVFTP